MIFLKIISLKKISSNLYYIMSLQQVNFMHIFIVGPLFYSIGVNQDITNWKITSLTTLMLLIPFIVRIPNKKMKKNR